MDIGFAFDDTLSAGLAAAVKRGDDLSPAMQAIAGVLEESTRYRFEQQAGPDAIGPWKPSARALKTGGQTLVDTGRLLASINSAFDKTSALVGTNVIYAAIQQFGGTITAKGKANGGADALKTPFGPRQSVTLPARPFLGFDADDSEEIVRILTDHLAEAA